MDSNIETGPTNYTVNGRIMLSSVIILFFVVSIMICFHSYARWFLYRRRRRFGRSAGDLFSNPVFPVTTASAGSASPQGLDLSILNTLPVFIYSSTTAHDPLPECAVCLSEFENEEHGRVLPVCKHAFHIECIDAWFQFHSNCPLCRAPVHFHIPVQYLPETSTETTLITVNEPPVSQSQLDDLGEAEMGSTGSSTQVILSPEWCHRKSGSGGLYFSVYIPSTTERGLELEGIGFGSSETQYQFQSPANRTLSLKRIWSI